MLNKGHGILEQVLVVLIERTGATHPQRTHFCREIAGKTARPDLMNRPNLGRRWRFAAAGKNRSGKIQSLLPGRKADAQGHTGGSTDETRPVNPESFSRPAGDDCHLIQPHLLRPRDRHTEQPSYSYDIARGETVFES